MSDDTEAPADTITEKPKKWVATNPLPEELYIEDSYYNCTTPEDWDEMVDKWEEKDGDKREKRRKKRQSNKKLGDNVVSFMDYKNSRNPSGPARY